MDHPDTTDGLPMPDWQRRTIGILGLAGAGIGIAMGVSQLAAAPFVAVELLYLPFIALYAWGGWIGVRLIEGHAGAVGPHLWFWAMQVLAVQASGLSFRFNSGAWVIVYVREPLNFGINAFVGSMFNASIAGDPQRFQLGVNVLAIAVMVMLMSTRRRIARRIGG